MTNAQAALLAAATVCADRFPTAAGRAGTSAYRHTARLGKGLGSGAVRTHAPHTRNVSLWAAPPARGRVPTPSPEVVAAAPQLAALHAALGDEPAPCASSPEVWTSSDEADALVAQEGCADCAARRQCAAYGAATGATCGVFGGTDRTARDGQRRSTNDTEMEQSA